MGQFGIETRRWLESAIKQRNLLLKNNKSHKSQLEVEIAIQLLDDQLSAYSYENSLYMARFIKQNIGHIENILPGKGSTCYKKRIDQLADINSKAIRIIEESEALDSQHREVSNQKTLEYEIQF